MQRHTPLMLFCFLLVATAGLALQLGLRPGAIDVFLADHTIYYPFVAAALWSVVILGIAHERRSAAVRLIARGWVMDVLDRLTNKDTLERLMAGQQRAIVIDADDLATRLGSHVVGQDAVCHDMAAQIRRRLALSQRNKPVGVFLLAGPPGTGKTYLGKRLSIELNRRLLHFDMTQFSEPHAATQLFGSPKGYVGSDSYGKLTGSLRDTPDAVVLLDEIEKADSEVHKKFLTAWNDGFVTEASDGKTISTSRAVFMLTTNAATDTLAELSRQFAAEPDELRRSSVGALREAGFAPEILNRIDRVFVFAPLQGLDIARVAALEIEDMIRGYGLEVASGGIEPQVLLTLMKRYDQLGRGASARDLARAIEETIGDSLIEARQTQAKTVALISRADGSIAAEVAG